MQSALTAITQVGVLVFVVAGMASMGLSLTMAQILGPLRDVRLVLGVVLANFVLVPLAAIAAARLIPMDDASAAAVILIGCCAGAPFLPTLAGLAKGSPALAVGVMVLLMVLTIGFAPLVVPALLQGATVAAGDIASSLVFYMLLPLALGLLARAFLPEVAERLAPTLKRASSLGLVIGIVAGLLVTWREVLGSVGTGVFVGTVLVILAGLVTGWLAGFGRGTSDRQVIGLASAQRNISAALVIAASLDTASMVRTLVAALVLPVLLIVLAGQIGKRSAAPVVSAAPQDS